MLNAEGLFAGPFLVVILVFMRSSMLRAIARSFVRSILPKIDYRAQFVELSVLHNFHLI